MPYSSGPGGHTLPEVNFLMVEIPTLKPYIYSLFSYLFIKQDQMIAFSIFLKKYGNYSDIDIY